MFFVPPKNHTKGYRLPLCWGNGAPSATQRSRLQAGDVDYVPFYFPNAVTTKDICFIVAQNTKNSTVSIALYKSAEDRLPGEKQVDIFSGKVASGLNKINTSINIEPGLVWLGFKNCTSSSDVYFQGIDKMDPMVITTDLLHIERPKVGLNKSASLDTVMPEKADFTTLDGYMVYCGINAVG